MRLEVFLSNSLFLGRIISADQFLNKVAVQYKYIKPGVAKVFSESWAEWPVLQVTLHVARAAPISSTTITGFEKEEGKGEEECDGL